VHEDQVRPAGDHLAGEIGQIIFVAAGVAPALDDQVLSLDQAKAALAGADAQIAAAQANIGVLEAQRAEQASTLASLQH